MGSVPLNVSFRRALVGQNLTLWYNLCASIAHIQLDDSTDCFRWNYHQNGHFSVKSMYLASISNGYIDRNKFIWKLKMPLKIKIFMWYLLKGVVLRKDNLARRNWNGGLTCCFCMKNETIQHLFMDCHYAKFIWRAVQFSFGLHLPRSMPHMFNGWLQGVDKDKRKLILVGASALCWALWHIDNGLGVGGKLSVDYLTGGSEMVDKCDSNGGNNNGLVSDNESYGPMEMSTTASMDDFARKFLAVAFHDRNGKKH
ncbi:uncharacterized protein [Oryza sativa Japonica Group]|uniref:uncharacterized protein n=1 Tax=Oryza sativa subsp. japonica TaxID=39947 RepID=UPI00339BB21E